MLNEQHEATATHYRDQFIQNNNQNVRF